MLNSEMLREQAKRHADAVKSIRDRSEQLGRDVTEAEYELASWHLEEAKRLKAQAEKIEGDAAIMAAAKEIGDSIGLDGNGSVSHPKVKALGGGNWGKSVVRASSDQFGNYKALIPSGAAPVSVPLRPEPVRIGEPVISLRQLIPAVQDNAGRWSYLRQTVRTSNANVVAPGAKKPTSISV